MEAGEAGAAFVAGKVDAAVTWEPWLSKTRETKHGKVLITSHDVPGLISDTFVVHKDVPKTRPEDVKKLLRAWFESIKFINSNRDEALAIMSKNLGIAKDELAGMLEGIRFPTYEDNLQYFGVAGGTNSFVETFQSAAAIWKDEGLINTTPGTQGIWDSSFLQNLYR
jgi:NitT/TauT family transport system substrate-binding protein